MDSAALVWRAPFLGQKPNPFLYDGADSDLPRRMRLRGSARIGFGSSTVHTIRIHRSIEETRGEEGEAVKLAIGSAVDRKEERWQLAP